MTPTLIIDCSITMAWCFEDEETAQTARVQEQMAQEAAVVPIHWSLEVTNVLAMAEKRNRIPAAGSVQFLKILGNFNIQVDDESSDRVFSQVLPLCRAHALTSYDAAYLDLALRRQVPLATLDNDLRRAAKSLGVELLGK